MSVDIHGQRLLIVDFGSQYTQLIARRVREAGVYCEIHPFDAPDDFFRDFDARGVVLSGGPETVTAADTPRIPDVIFDLGGAGSRNLLRHAGHGRPARGAGPGFAGT